MRRFALYGSAAVILLCLVVTALKITTYSAPIPPCPHCGSPNVVIGNKHPNATSMICSDCNGYWYAPPRADFSWAAALEYAIDGPEPFEPGEVVGRPEGRH